MPLSWQLISLKNKKEVFYCSKTYRFLISSWYWVLRNKSLQWASNAKRVPMKLLTPQQMLKVNETNVWGDTHSKPRVINIFKKQISWNSELCGCYWVRVHSLCLPLYWWKLVVWGWLWVNGRAGGRSFKPSLLKQSSLSLLISPSSTPFLAPVARPIQRIDTHWLGLEEEQDGELV